MMQKPKVSDCTGKKKKKNGALGQISLDPVNLHILCMYIFRGHACATVADFTLKPGLF